MWEEVFENLHNSVVAKLICSGSTPVHPDFHAFALQQLVEQADKLACVEQPAASTGTSEQEGTKHIEQHHARLAQVPQQLQVRPTVACGLVDKAASVEAEPALLP